MLRIAMVGAAALLIAGCSSSDSPPAPESPPASTGHGSLAACLHDNGVPDTVGPGAAPGPPAGVDQSTWDRAMSACGQFAPGPPAP